MSITRYYVETRPNTTVQFATDNPTLTHIADSISLVQEFVAAGNVTYTVDVSSDGLTKTRSRTVSTLDDFNSVESVLRDFNSIKQSAEYRQANNLSFIANLVGIDQPFTVTTTYNLSNITTNIAFIGEQVSSLATKNLSNIIVGTDTITIVHTYDNCDDFSKNNVLSYQQTESKMLEGSTVDSRQQIYALV
jgi:hypothetical protein